MLTAYYDDYAVVFTLLLKDKNLHLDLCSGPYPPFAAQGSTSLQPTARPGLQTVGSLGFSGMPMPLRNESYHLGEQVV